MIPMYSLHKNKKRLMIPTSSLYTNGKTDDPHAVLEFRKIKLVASMH